MSLSIALHKEDGGNWDEIMEQPTYLREAAYPKLQL
jgi:hypothetical protein